MKERRASGYSSKVYKDYISTVNWLEEREVKRAHLWNYCWITKVFNNKNFGYLSESKYVHIFIEQGFMHTYIHCFSLLIHLSHHHPSIDLPTHLSIHSSKFFFLHSAPNAKPWGFTDEKHYLCLSLILERQILNIELANLVLDENCDQYYGRNRQYSDCLHQGFLKLSGGRKVFLGDISSEEYIQTHYLMGEHGGLDEEQFWKRRNICRTLNEKDHSTYKKLKEDKCD